MDGYIVYGGMQMTRGSLARIEDGRGILLSVWDGGLWITEEGNHRDYYIRAGERFQLKREGVTLAYAMQRANLTVTAPVPAHFARRIALIVPGSRAPRVLYDRAQERGSRLDGLRQRMKRFWVNSYAPLSRPTTAAL